jgi:hypothetical protein
VASALSPSGAKVVVRAEAILDKTPQEAGQRAPLGNSPFLGAPAQVGGQHHSTRHHSLAALHRTPRNRCGDHAEPSNFLQRNAKVGARIKEIADRAERK